MEDNGASIPDEMLAEVRRGFIRADAGKPGVGLGLPVAEVIAAPFGGALGLPGRGMAGGLSRVGISLPKRCHLLCLRKAIR